MENSEVWQVRPFGDDSPLLTTSMDPDPWPLTDSLMELFCKRLYGWWLIKWTKMAKFPIAVQNRFLC